ncbi:appetite-regulating hormone isoform X2 [Eretmochelys imbricata]
MFLRSTMLGILLICILWTETILAGSSFLSPEYQNTQQRKDPKKHTTKLNRRAAEGLLDADARQIEGDNEIEIKITEDQYQEYGQVLEKILEDILAEDTLDAINRSPNVLPVNSRTPACERRKRSPRGSGSSRLAAILTAR